MRRTSWRQLIRYAVMYAILGVLTAFSLFPILWGLGTSLKPNTVINAYPPEWIPSQVTVDHYVRVVTGSNMPLYFRNSIIVLLGTALISILVASHAAYAADRFQFRGKNAILFAILCTVMIPGIAVLIPLYMLVNLVGLHDTLLSIILIYSAWLVPTCLWIMQGFFASVPHELDEAGLVDGCSRLQVFYRIIWPLIWPGIGAVAIVVFRYAWNEFIIALTMSSSEYTRTIPVGLYHFVTGFGIEWGKLMAAVMLALIPVVIVFIALQRKFVQGLTSGALKG